MRENRTHELCEKKHRILKCKRVAILKTAVLRVYLKNPLLNQHIFVIPTRAAGHLLSIASLTTLTILDSESILHTSSSYEADIFDKLSMIFPE